MYDQKPLLHKRQAAHKPGQLRTIALDVTSRCNMTCDHCYAETFNNVGMADLKTLIRTLDEFYDMGVFHYVIQGGEPIVSKERLESVLIHCHPEEAYINVVSNGWGMTRETIKWLKDLKVDKITFSLDSGIEAQHDESRLPDSYRRVIEAIDEVKASGLVVSVSTVVTHESLYSEGFKRALQLVLEKNIQMDVQIAEPVGKWDGIVDNLITPEDAAYIRGLRDALGTMENGLGRINRDVYCGDREHCPAGTEFMGLSANGEFLPCNFLQFSLGNIHEQSVREMREMLLSSSWFDDSHSVCLCGEDQEFIDKFIVPFKGLPKPLDAVEVFNLKVASAENHS